MIPSIRNCKRKVPGSYPRRGLRPREERKTAALRAAPRTPTPPRRDSSHAGTFTAAGIPLCFSRSRGVVPPAPQEKMRTGVPPDSLGAAAAAVAAAYGRRSRSLCSLLVRGCCRWGRHAPLPPRLAPRSLPAERPPGPRGGVGGGGPSAVLSPLPPIERERNTD